MQKSDRSPTPLNFARRAWLVVVIGGCLGLALPGCVSPLPNTDSRPQTASDFIGRPRPPLP